MPPCSLVAALLAPFVSPANETAPFARFAVSAPTRVQAPEEERPWRLERALGAPEWFLLTGEQRTRFESLDEDFRVGRNGHNQLFALRTLLRADVRQEQLTLSLELQDSRQVGVPSKGFLDTGIVNPVELLQAYAALTFEDVIDPGDRLRVLAGRHTMDLGSRRFAARNGYRNSINAFTGLNATWENEAGASGRAFFTLPVQRLPNDADGLRDNDIEFDEERKQVRFFGLHGSTPTFARGLDAEVYALGLDEEDGRDLATRNRRLWTLGARLRRERAPGSFDFDVESAYQFGRSRASSQATDRTDLDHSAHLHHAEAAYTFDVPTTPRLAALFDYGSGDESPNDGDNNRFDTLYGALETDFAPTSIFRPFALSNLVAAGSQLRFRPSESTHVMIGHRFHWLASGRDAWVTSEGLRDPNGDSGRSLGQLLEVRTRWDFVPENVRFEFGAAHLFADEFQDDAPNSTGRRDSTYLYVSTTFWF